MTFNVLCLYRVLGKLGGGNRKMMNEPQKLDYQTNRTNNPAVVVQFVDYSMPINLCLQKVIIISSVYSKALPNLLLIYELFSSRLWKQL